LNFLNFRVNAIVLRDKWDKDNKLASIRADLKRIKTECMWAFGMKRRRRIKKSTEGSPRTVSSDNTENVNIKRLQKSTEEEKRQMSLTKQKEIIKQSKKVVNNSKDNDPKPKPEVKKNTKKVAKFKRGFTTKKEIQDKEAEKEETSPSPCKDNNIENELNFEQNIKIEESEKKHIDDELIKMAKNISKIEAKAEELNAQD
jgi:hypothetical protein